MGAADDETLADLLLGKSRFGARQPAADRHERTDDRWDESGKHFGDRQGGDEFGFTLRPIEFAVQVVTSFVEVVQLLGRRFFKALGTRTQALPKYFPVLLEGMIFSLHR